MSITKKNNFLEIYKNTCAMENEYENKTVKDLRDLAKKLGVKYYYTMKKADLIRVLKNPLDDSIPENFTADVLTPTKYTEAKYIEAKYVEAKNAEASLKSKVMDGISSFTEWITSYIPETIKKPVDEKLEALKSKVSDLFSKFGLRKQTVEFTLSKSALKGVTKQFTVQGIIGYDAQSFMNLVKNNAISILDSNRSTKVTLVLSCNMERVDLKSGEAINTVAPFSTKAEVVLASTDLKDLYERAVHKIMESLSTFQQMGSSWRFVSVKKMDINVFVYNPLKAKSYIPLDKTLADKKAIINMKNEDNECFKWCVTRALNPVDDNAAKISKILREQAEKLNWDGIEFPVSLDQITRFEKNNSDISINVFGYCTSVYPLRISTCKNRQHQIDLLLISNEVNTHYCLINSLSRLLSSQTSRCKQTRYYCRNCLLGYCSEESLAKHKLYCDNHNAVRIELPGPGSKMSFIHYNRSMRVPFVVYADFESFIKPINTCNPDPSKSYTNQYQKHTPSSFCYYIKCFDNTLYFKKPVTFTASNDEDDVAQKFVDSLEANIKLIYNKYKFPKEMIFSGEDAKKFTSAFACHICGGELGEDRVRDHCHLTGRYRGPAHNGCNLHYKIPKFFPVIFHNLSGYDSHLFIKKLSGGKITCIPNNEEKYISFSREIVVDEFTNKEGKNVKVKRELRFIDSFRFMPTNLDNLSKNLTKDQCKNVGLRYSGKKLDLLLRKGVYPYDWVDSISKLDETKLPPKEAFYSKLNCEGISDEDYTHAQTVWNEFNCRTFRDYHDLYNVSDVLLLADVFENFRDVCMNCYKLDPAWYFTSPGLAWDAALKKTNIELELLSDYDMILMIKQGIRGGISMISNRLGTSNNAYMGNGYDPSKPSSFIQYLDANNLYGWAMSKPLPTKGFKWMSEDELANWKSIPCMLEVDLEYPTELHDLHNDYPLAPESITIGKVNKLVPNLNDKSNYIVHYENLKLYESLGLKITKIHRGIKFEERAWLSEYIELNTKLRTKATNDFEKDFFKLMNNSVFGKTMENIENRVDIRLVTDENEAVKLASMPNYESRTIFDENLIAVHMKRTKLVYNKPIYLGMCILDLSKTLMYDFHYNYMKNKYSDRAKLLFTDTDSLAYEIKTEDFYADIANDVESRFDTSEYDANHPAVHTAGFKVGVNKKVIGMFKDESGGKQIEEFVGLRSKLYSYKVFGEEHKKCKGVKKNVVKQSITHDDYKNCLLTGREHLRSMNVIRSHLHEIYTEEINKIALSANDDKRVILEDGIHTLAYGHYTLRGH